MQYENMNVLDQLQADLAALDEAALKRGRNTLSPIEEGEKVLGTVTSAHAIGLWTLAMEYQRQAYLIAIASKYEEGNEAERRAMKYSAFRLVLLENAAKELAWAAFRMDVNTDEAWDLDSLGIRKDFALVSKPDEAPAPAEVASMVGRALGVTLLHGLGPVDLPEEEDAKPKKERKPQ